MRVKGGMYCERCGKPIEAIRQGHPAHHPVSGVTGPLTRNWERLDVKSAGWVCPDCGWPVVPVAQARPK